MAARVAAAAVLFAAAAAGWLAISVPLAARALQISIAASLAYVAWLAWHGWRVMRRAMPEPAAGVEPAEAPTDGPFVSLVMPARDEAGVVGRAVRSLRAVAYVSPDGAPGFELVVVDDGSTDGTGQAANAGDSWPQLRVVRREPGAVRTKAAALAFAMPHLRGEVVGVVDADSTVEPDFLRGAMSAWRRDPTAAALQVRRDPQDHASWLVGAQGEEQLLDLASQCGRWATDGTAELRGNGMFIRRQVLDAVGGWNDRALTEDLELSTRLSSAGHHVTLAPEVVVHEEAVEGLGALWRQRMRWAEGSIRRLLEHGPALLAGPQPLGRKADFLAFSAEFVVPPLFAASLIAALVKAALSLDVDWTVPAWLALSYAIGSFILALAGLAAAGERGARLVGRAARGALFLSHWLLVVPAALVRIAVGPETTTFVRTPRSTRLPGA